MVCHIIRVIFCLALCVLCHCAPAMQSQDPTCMCYVDFYNCDIACVSQYKTKHNVLNICMGMCVRNYAGCRARCNGESIQLSMPSQIKLPAEIEALF